MRPESPFISKRTSGGDDTVADGDRERLLAYIRRKDGCTPAQIVQWGYVRDADGTIAELVERNEIYYVVDPHVGVVYHAYHKK